jgi:CRISPR-associated protein Csd2
MAKRQRNLLKNRHDMLCLIDASMSNPNGDPDAGNQPRQDPMTGLGLLSDGSTKRKLRDFVAATMREPGPDGEQYGIFIAAGTILGDTLNRTSKQAIQAKEPGDDRTDAELASALICNTFWDTRAFGAVLSVGGEDAVMRGSPFGQVRGPVQVSFGQSLDPINPLELTLTRLAVTRPQDAAKERTMGNKWVVPYALYMFRIFMSPYFAERTGFTENDYHVTVRALKNLYAFDKSAARPDMTVRGLWDFEHEGLGGRHNEREAQLGCAHAHKLFDTIKITRNNPGKPPASFADYKVENTFLPEHFPGVRLHVHTDPYK